MIVILILTILLPISHQITLSSVGSKNISQQLPTTSSYDPSFFWNRLQQNQIKYDTGRRPEIADPSSFKFDEHPYNQHDVLLRPGLMLEILGFANYDPKYMRLSTPMDVEELDYPRPPRKLPRMTDLFSKNTVKLPYGNLMRLRFLDRRSRRKLRRFLWAYSSCPVRHRWRDLGKGFWPKWIKYGECVQSENSCSVPPGMTCKRHRYHTIMVLRYLCPKHWDVKQCRWAKQAMQILVECTCQC